MGGRIFINYRRHDDPGFTQLLYQRLEQEFARDQLFMDIEGYIRPGDVFTDVLSRQVASADVLLAVIGPKWLDLLAAHRDGMEDFVSIEIQAALDQSKRVIPVLVGGASMPRGDSLPETIRPLSRRHAVALRPERFRVDCTDFIKDLKATLEAAGSAAVRPAPVAAAPAPAAVQPAAPPSSDLLADLQGRFGSPAAAPTPKPPEVAPEASLIDDLSRRFK